MLLSSRKPPHPALSREGRGFPEVIFYIPLPSRERSEMFVLRVRGIRCLYVRRKPPHPALSREGRGFPEGHFTYLSPRGTLSFRTGARLHPRATGLSLSA